MRKLAFGAALVASTAALSVPVMGLAGSTGKSGTGGLFHAPEASADEALPAFDSCQQLLDWYIDKALPLVGPYGLGYPYPIWGDVAFARDSRVFNMGGTPDSATVPVAQGTAGEDVQNSGTGTNVQESGVDEPDLAKTDGRLVVNVHEGELVVTDVTGDRPVELSRTKLPKDFWGQDLLLVGDRVLLTGTSGGIGLERMPADFIGVAGDDTRVLTFSLAEPRHPSLVDDETYDGRPVEVRQYGGVVRLVLQSSLPRLQFVQPRGTRSESEARRRNRQIVRDSTIEDWLPGVTAAGKHRGLLDCGDVRHPRTSSGLGTLSIVTLDPSDPTSRSAVAVTTSGNLAYSSTDRLYVATPVDRGESRCLEVCIMGPIRPKPEPTPAKTEVHAFALDGLSTAYVASGTIPGAVRDRWSFDEHDGYLRVASALTKGWETTDNAVTVLREDGSSLTVTGSVRHLGPDEQIQSVRWFDDLAVVVTFRQMDPLYTVDLSDPAHPTVLGALKIPGFSSYLHPVGDDRLLGLGTAATKTGQRISPQIATFDIKDLRNPRQLSVVKLAADEELTAAYDPRAFTYLGNGIAFTTVSDWTGHAHIQMLRISEAGNLSLGADYPAEYDARVLPVEGGRVALVGSEVRLVDVR